MRKAQVMGAGVGFGITVAALVLSSHTTDHNGFMYPVFVLNLLLCAPAALVCQVLGIKVMLGAETSRLGVGAWYALVVLSNMAIFALVGYTVGWLREQRRARSSLGHE